MVNPTNPHEEPEQREVAPRLVGHIGHSPDYKSPANLQGDVLKVTETFSLSDSRRESDPIGFDLGLKITKVTILISRLGPDRVMLHTTLPSPFVPAVSKDPLTLDFSVASGLGEQYVRDHIFPCLLPRSGLTAPEIEVISTDA